MGFFQDSFDLLNSKPEYSTGNGSNSDPVRSKTNEILQNIEANPGGPASANRLSTYLQEFAKLKADVNSGNLSQSDYVAISDNIVPQFTQWANRGASSSQAIAQAYNAGGLLDKVYDLSVDHNIYKNAQQLLGRDLTDSELAQIKPAFQGPNGEVNGKAALGQLAEYDKKNPNSPNSPFNQNNPKNTLNQFDPQVQGIFNDLLKRGANQDELKHFESLIASGQADPYTIRQFVQQLPEYQNAQDKQFRSELSGELEGYENTAFDRTKQNLISQYMQNGQGGLGGSPSLDFAITNARAELLNNRNQFLTGLSAKQYEGNKAAAGSDYNRSLDQFYGDKNYNTQRSDYLQDLYRNRGFEGQDYQTQQRDYRDLLNNIPQQKPNVFDYLNTGANVAGGIANIAKLF